ncbi:MAG TPA: energy-coupling factor transporter transmembrane protein EcfT [bacterium]|nr:energy-coupling factor transporter transmembrane protein EcfT [bacterium]
MITGKTLILGRYAPRDSRVHSLDPRTKMIALCFLMGLTFLIRRADLLILYTVPVLLIYPLSGLSARLAFGSIRPFMWLLLFTVFLHGFLTEGRILFSLPLVRAGFTLEGLMNGLFYGFRIILLIVTANLLTLTTSPMALTDGIEKLLKPFQRFGIPAHELAMMMSISMRFIPILLEESERIQRAQMSRGARFDGGLIRKLKAMIPILIPLFVSTFRKANDLALAMDARCYRGGESRTHFQILRFGRADGWACAAVLMLVCVVLFLQYNVLHAGGNISPEPF